MNLHVFEVVLLIHANECLHKGDWVKSERGESPSKQRDCLISLRLLVLVQLVEAILLSKHLYDYRRCPVLAKPIWEQQAGIYAWAYLI